MRKQRERNQEKNIDMDLLQKELFKLQEEKKKEIEKEEEARKYHKLCVQESLNQKHRFLEQRKLAEEIEKRRYNENCQQLMKEEKEMTNEVVNRKFNIANALKAVYEQQENDKRSWLKVDDTKITPKVLQNAFIDPHISYNRYNLPVASVQPTKKNASLEFAKRDSTPNINKDMRYSINPLAINNQYDNIQEKNQSMKTIIQDNNKLSLRPHVENQYNPQYQMNEKFTGRNPLLHNNSVVGNYCPISPTVANKNQTFDSPYIRKLSVDNNQPTTNYVPQEPYNKPLTLQNQNPNGMNHEQLKKLNGLRQKLFCESKEDANPYEVDAPGDDRAINAYRHRTRRLFKKQNQYEGPNYLQYDCNPNQKFAGMRHKQAGYNIINGFGPSPKSFIDQKGNNARLPDFLARKYTGPYCGFDGAQAQLKLPYIK